MKKYLADILTLLRFILAMALLAMAIFDSQADIGTGFLIFVIAELTDAFDGTFATKYPFPKNKAPKYRKYAAKYDMFADALTALAAALFFTFHVDFAAGLTIIIFYGLLALAVEAIVYGRLFGHPDSCAPSSLIKRNFPLAKKIIMARRALYLVFIAVVATWTLYASAWAPAVKIAITIVAIAVSVFLWFFLAQRRHNISRDAVQIEKSLTKKSHKE